jgi:hypothetical protein
MMSGLFIDMHNVFVRIESQVFKKDNGLTDIKFERLLNDLKQIQICIYFINMSNKMNFLFLIY